MSAVNTIRQLRAEADRRAIAAEKAEEENAENFDADRAESAACDRGWSNGVYQTLRVVALVLRMKEEDP